MFCPSALAALGSRTNNAAMSETQAQIRITVNGEVRECAPGLTLEGLIAALELDTRKLAVERNLEIVPRSQYAATVLAEGDALEIVNFVGGG